MTVQVRYAGMAMIDKPSGQHNKSMGESPRRRTTGRPRIETQIHRRSKAKAVLPLEAEWQTGSERPVSLKMPTEKMDKHGNASK